MKPGTIEGIQRRLGRLEAAFEQQGIAPAAAPADAPADGPDSGQPASSTSSDLQNLVALFVKELQSVRKEPAAGSGQLSAPTPTPGEHDTARPRPTRTQDYHEEDSYNQGQARSPKRRRIDGGLADEDDGLTAGLTSQPFQDVLQPLPTGAALTAMIHTYFIHIHPWIPMIQEHRFRNRLSDPQERPKLDLILYAMLVSTNCHSKNPALEPRQLEQVRNWIVSEGIGAFSVEALQALTIIAFVDVSFLRALPPFGLNTVLTRRRSEMARDPKPGPSSAHSREPPSISS